MDKAVNIKEDLVSLIGKVNDTNLLELAYQVLSNASNEKEMMGRLSKNQLEELNQSVTESYQEDNLYRLRNKMSHISYLECSFSSSSAFTNSTFLKK